MLSKDTVQSTGTDRRFRLVIAGCGAVTETAHLPAALSLPHIQVTALVDTSLERAKDLAQSFGLQTRVFESLEEALNLADGILIATPNHTHFALAALALSNNIHVLVEKPLTTTYEDAVVLCRLAEEKQVVLAVGFSTRFYPGNRLLTKLLAQRYFGTLRTLQYEYGTWGGWAPYSMYNIDRQYSGGGVLVVTGSHFFDRLINWFGLPDVLAYWDDSYGGPEANALGVLRVRGSDKEEFEAKFFLSKTVQLKNRLSLQTDRYTVELSEEQTAKIVAIPHDNPELRIVFSDSTESQFKRPAAALQLEDFVDAARKSRMPTVDGRAGSQSVRLTEKVYAIRQKLPEPWMWYATRQNGVGS